MTGEVEVGLLCRDYVGGYVQMVVAVDDFVWVKRADSSKKDLARKAGAYPVSHSEFALWTKLNAKEPK